MSRYTGPVWKVSRRLGYSVLGTGVELNGEHKDKIPGQHADAHPKKKTEYTAGISRPCDERYNRRLGDIGLLRIEQDSKCTILIIKE